MAGHLVAAGSLVDEDPEAALAHARAARDRASRIALVREAVGVAAYHAGDYAEAARELRAYRRMSGDPGYRAVLADVERALGRPEVALRLVAEALAETTDADEVAELRLVEAGARRDLGETAAARLLLEGALGGRPRPENLTADDPVRLRLAAAYAEQLEAEGDSERAAQWHAAVIAADPSAAEDEVEFLEVDLPEDADTEPADSEPADREPAHSEPAGPESPGEAASPGGRIFEDDVEAEVAELLAETETEPDADVTEGPSTED